MKRNEFKKEVLFGINNLDRVYQNIMLFIQQDVEEQIKSSALTYECLGYYNAIEHLIIRTLKFMKIEIDSNQFSHKETLKKFKILLKDRKIEREEKIVQVIENLMAFRHIATKIYGFLIDWKKLHEIINDIKGTHPKILKLFLKLLDNIVLNEN